MGLFYFFAIQKAKVTPVAAHGQCLCAHKLNCGGKCAVNNRVILAKVLAKLWAAKFCGGGKVDTGPAIKTEGFIVVF